MPTVFANGRSILHAGDGLKHTAAPPDVCKTPSPGGPVPVPYVNIASDGDLAKGTKKTKIEGKSVALESSNLSTSMGDEPGTAGGGIVSSKTKGKMTWGTASADVKFEGKGVARFMDVTQHNGNSFNSAFTSLGGTGLAYADDFEGNCGICGKGPREHRVLETTSSAHLCREIVLQLISQFQAQTSNNQKKKYAKPAGGGRWKGYMVGVMLCKHEPPQSIATMSGTTLPGFVSVASGIVDIVLEGGGASPADMVQANASNVATADQKAMAIQKAWDRIEGLRGGTDPEAKAGYNIPGTCAGAKLMAKAGHAPLEMTEMFFMPPGQAEQWEATYRVLTTVRTQEQLAGYSQSWRNKILQNKAAQVQATRYQFDSVASCQTCQELLYMTNCPVRSC